MGIKHTWSVQPASTKRLLAMLGAAVPMLVVVYFLVASDEGSTFKTDKNDEVEVNILTGSSAKKIGIESLANRQQAYEKEIKRLGETIQRLESGAEVSDKQNDAKMDEINQRLNKLLKMQQNSGLANQNRRQAAGALQITEQANRNNSVNLNTGLAGTPSLQNTDQGALNSQSKQTISQPSAPQGTWDMFSDPEPADESKGSGFSVSGATEPSSIREFVQEIPKTEEDSGENVYIPATTIVTGVLINGIDAPTSKSSQSEPHPALVRIKHDAILPNYFTVDIKECFVIISGFGELSSERAHLRGETISCVRNDGGVIETKFYAYAVGEDSKEGLRGRVVSKQGQVIARAMLAGFAGGLSDIFKPRRLAGLQTSPGSSLQFQTPGFGNATKAAGFSGASSAMEKLAEHYVELAKNIFPVIEISGGRQIDMVMTKGITLKLKGRATTKNVAMNGGF